MKQALKDIAKRAGLTRQSVEAMRMSAERHALAAVGARRARTHGRILCYHSVGQPRFGVNDVSPDRFRRQIELALELGYRFVAPGELAAHGGGPKDLAVSFDDALRSVMTEAHPVLMQYKIPYSVFAVSEWSNHVEDWHKQDVLGWADLEKLIADGVEVGGHSATHCNFGDVDIASAKREFASSRETMKAKLGFAPSVFAIPFGQSNNWTPETDAAAREAGFTTIYAQAEETRPTGTIGRTFVTHFDNDLIFKALLGGAYDRWEEWLWKY